MRRRELLTWTAAMLAGGAIATTAWAADWKPTRPIEIVVPSGPGGGLDLVGRTLQAVMEQEKLTEVPVTVLNKPGGSGTVGIAYINSHPHSGNYVCIQALPLITNTITGQSEIGALLRYAAADGLIENEIGPQELFDRTTADELRF